MVQLHVKGRTCGHGVAASKQAIAGVASVAEVQVDLAAGRLEVPGASHMDAVIEAIRAVGYEVGPAKVASPAAVADRLAWTGQGSLACSRALRLGTDPSIGMSSTETPSSGRCVLKVSTIEAAPAAPPGRSVIGSGG
jgi:copper chaperone CopZ